MQIDWLTVAAQIFNFLVLAWLLKRFLYRPVIDAMNQRERKIADRLEQAEQRELQAQSEAGAYREKVAALDRDRHAALEAAREAAEQERRQLVEAARSEVSISRERWQHDLEREQADFRDALVHELADAAVAVARHALADLADAGLESQALATLARQIAELPDAQRQALAAAKPRLQLATTFEPDGGALEALRLALSAALGGEIALDCVRKPELVFGAELSGAGHKLAWSLSGHLDEIAAGVRSSIDDALDAAQQASDGTHERAGASQAAH